MIDLIKCDCPIAFDDEVTAWMPEGVSRWTTKSYLKESIQCPDCQGSCIVQSIEHSSFFAVKCQCCTVTGPRRTFPDDARVAFLRLFPNELHFRTEHQLSLPVR